MTTTSDDATLHAKLRAALTLERRTHHTVLELTAELASSDLPATSGYRSMARLLQDLAHVDAHTAKRWLTDAGNLTERFSMTGEPQEPVYPATATASHDGEISPEHMRVIDRAMTAVGRIPDLDPAVVADAEATLAEAATRLAPRAVEKVAMRLLAYLDPDGVAPLDPPPVTDELLLSIRRDGSITLSARIFGAAHAETLREVFDALSAPAGPDDTRSLAQRQADALVELAEQAMLTGGVAAEETEDDRPTDDRLTDDAPANDDPADVEPADVEPAPGDPAAPRPAATRGRPLLMITIDHRALLEGLGHGLLDSDRTIAASEARRLACDAGVIPAVLGSRSQPLDVGRLSYTVPDGMRRALHLRDRGCTFPGCTRRPRRCHSHHLRHWIDDGPTKIENLTLLCRFHHQLVHHGEWEIHMCEGRPWFTPPSWIDPRRTPRPGGPHPPGP